MISPDKKNLSHIGLVNKTSGFKGGLSCIVEIAHPERLLKQKFLFVIIDGLPVPFFIEEMEIRGDEMIIKFEDVNSQEDAKKLLRKQLFSEKLRISKKEDVLSWNDLKGYQVIDDTEGNIGSIEEVLEYPMQMIAKCNMNGKEILFPLNDDIVTGISEDEKIVFVDLPGGLLSLYSEQ